MIACHRGLEGIVAKRADSPYVDCAGRMGKGNEEGGFVWGWRSRGGDVVGACSLVITALRGAGLEESWNRLYPAARSAIFTTGFSHLNRSDRRFASRRRH